MPLFAARAATAQTSSGSTGEASICLIAPSRQSELLQDALHRIVAELHAAQFVVERVYDTIDADLDDAVSDFSVLVPSPCRGASGHLLLRPSGAVLSILATAGAEDTPLTQDIHLADRATTAEVIAIRAVEALRAAMIQAMRSDETRREFSDTVRRFTHQDAAERNEEKPLRMVDAESKRLAPDQDAENPAPRQLRAFFALGAGVGVDGGETGLPAELSASWRIGDLALGAILDASVLPSTWNSTVGTLALRQYSLVGRVALRVPCAAAMECELGMNAGVREVSIHASPNNDGDTVSESHTTALISGEAFGGYFFHPSWGLGVRVRTGVLLNAPALNVGDDEKLWGRPTVTAALLFLVRY